MFSDSIFVLRRYGEMLGLPFIEGSTKDIERRHFLDKFKQPGSDTSCILLSKVGDTSIDLPDANVLIEISAHYGSRRQEAQRLGTYAGLL